MKRTSICLSIALMILPFGAMAHSRIPPPDQLTKDAVDVKHVMSAYHEAIVTHDGTRLASLFIPKGSVWLNVLSDKAFTRLRKSKPGISKIKVGSYRDFAQVVSQSTENMDPRHAHVLIQSDGTIASVYFKFVFMVNGRPENRGSETWTLVKGDDGWRIAAIIYSSNPVGS